MPDPTLDPQAILTALGHPNARVVAPVGGGRDAAIWCVAEGDDAYALRVFPPGRVESTRREVAAMRAAVAGGIPAPAVQAFEVWHGHAALLLAWCPGHPLLTELQARPWRVYALGHMAGACLARIHRIQAPADLCPWAESTGIGGDVLAHRLAAAPHARSDAVLHLDYHPLNILTTGREVSAVLDWTNACAGDPRADLARAITILRLDAGQLSPPKRALVRLYELGLRRGYGPVEDLAPFLAWAGSYLRADLVHRADATQLARIDTWIARWLRRAGL
jgi:aminoglycoside phosphotransferase (APT) family kinase protein